MRLTVLFCVIALLLTACANEQTACPSLPGGGSYCLQAGGPVFSIVQQSSLKFGERRMSFLTRIENDADGLRFAGLTPLGQTLLLISWENNVLRAEIPPSMAEKMSPALLPALVQIAMWPAEAVRSGLAPTLTLKEEPYRRRILAGNSGDDEKTKQDVLTISWEGNLPYTRLRITAPTIGLEIDARTLTEESRP